MITSTYVLLNIGQLKLVLRKNYECGMCFSQIDKWGNDTEDQKKWTEIV